MNESYVECMVKRKASPFAGVIKTVVYILAGLSLFLVATGYYVAIVTLLIFGLIAFLVVPNLDLEFEYLYVDRELSIDKIMNKQKRKKVKNIELAKMEFMCPLNSHELDSYRAKKTNMLDFSSKAPEAKAYVIVYRDQSKEELICFEPNEEMIAVIKSVYPRKVIEY